MILLTRWIYTIIVTIVTLAICSIIDSKYGYFKYHQLFDFTAVAVGISAVLLYPYIEKATNQFKKYRLIQKLFKNSIDIKVLEKLQLQPVESLKFDGDTRYVTMMFCDLSDFPSIVKQYGNDSQKITNFINRFVSEISAVIIANHGVIDKYMNTCVIAFWNAPIDIPNHRLLAVKTAIDVTDYIRILNAEIVNSGLQPIGIRIGIHSGEVIVGNIGNYIRNNYTCIGDNVSYTETLKNMCDDYKVKIIASNDVASAIDNEFVKIEIDIIADDKTNSEVKIFTIINEKLLPNKIHLHTAAVTHQKFLEAYRDQRWDRALILSKSLSTGWNFQLKDFYINMCKKCQLMKDQQTTSS